MSGSGFTWPYELSVYRQLALLFQKREKWPTKKNVNERATNVCVCVCVYVRARERERES
jgi:hypothetical protein